MAIKELRFKAKYKKVDEIEVILPLEELEKEKRFTLVRDGIAIAILKIIERLAIDNKAMFILACDKIELGYRYQVADETYEKTILSVKEVPNFPSFDSEYTYLGDDLGTIYGEHETRFALWAPLCSRVHLVINGTKYRMNRSEKGVYRFILNGNLDGAIYYYEVVIDDKLLKVTDPYAIGSTLNSRESVVINRNKCLIDLNQQFLTPLIRNTDAVIYELSVRDFTSCKNTNILNKGTFLGMIEEGKKSDQGEVVGFDYLKELGVTHVQLMPIFDFYTVDEEQPQLKYNWGYDPRQFNVVEGSLASDRYNPYGRIIELKKMVAALHRQNIKVNMDVVYNHVYAYEYSVFETIVPNYFFRKNANGELSNGSFCGNDFDSTRPMCQKFIIDSVKFWMEEYGIDGFRFDLMAIIDKDTMRKIVELVHSIKNDAMIYGEGWNMPTALIDEKKSSINNAHKLPDIAFFNDLFRDCLKGGTMDHDDSSRGYGLNNQALRGAFKYAFKGSCIKTSRENMFLNANQSINYIECHDNATLFDKIKFCFEDKTTSEILKKLKLLNALTAFSLGVPFFHMGQEVGLSKNGNKNSYNAGDAINQFDYRILHKRKALLKHFKDALLIRKKYEELRIDDPEIIKDVVKFINLNDGAMIVSIKLKDSNIKELLIAINPSDVAQYYDLGTYYQIVFNEIGIPKEALFAQSLILNPENIVILEQK